LKEEPGGRHPSEGGSVNSCSCHQAEPSWVERSWGGAGLRPAYRLRPCAGL